MLIIFFRWIFILSVFSWTTIAAAGNTNLSAALQNTNLPEAIRLIADILNMNVIISPSVQGAATLNLDDASPAQAFDTLLVSHALAKSRKGNVWWIAPQNEMIKFKQEELKWRDLEEEAAPLLTQVRQINYAKAADIARLLEDERASFLSKRGHVRVDSRTNMICIQDTAKRLENLRILIRRLDIPVQQISIAARLVSVDSDFEQELGVQFAVKQGLNEAGENVRGIQSNQEKGRYSLAVAKLADGSLLDVKLTALENAGHAELISSPGLFTANQQLASIEAGEEVPYQEVSDSGGTATVFKKAVLGLKVTPQILPGKNVLLQLQINQDRPGSKMIQGMPTISTRQMTTSVLVKSGQTIVLGGIYEENTERGQLGLPFISRIPWIGLLFRQQNIRDNRRELLIFVTPAIVD
jgi:type IV pilus assembly protein PilQ